MQILIDKKNKLEQTLAKAEQARLKIQELSNLIFQSD